MDENRNQPELWPGWRTIRKIGTGSYGAVYEIQRDILGDGYVESAALKMISIPRTNDEIVTMMEDGFNKETLTATYNDKAKNILQEYHLLQQLKDSSNVVNCEDVRVIHHNDGIGYDIFIRMELLTLLKPCWVSLKRMNILLQTVHGSANRQRMQLQTEPCKIQIPKILCGGCGRAATTVLGTLQMSTRMAPLMIMVIM